MEKRKTRDLALFFLHEKGPGINPKMRWNSNAQNRFRQKGVFPVPVGNILLVIVAVLIFFGVLHRVLDRMRLSDRTAAAIVIAMVVGSFFDFTVQRAPITVRINLGGALIPLIVAIWLIATAGAGYEKARSIFSAIASGIVIWALAKVLNPEEQLMRFSPMLVEGIAAGIIAAVAGRSRRSAFVGGLGGMMISDVFHWIELAVRKIPGTVDFGGAGAFDATVISAIIAVGLMEIFGEAREKMVVQPGRAKEETHDAKEEGGRQDENK